MTATSLVELIQKGAERVDPAKIAVAGKSNLTYEDLLRGARGIAITLAAHGVRRGDRVAFWMDKTPQAVQTLIGIMWAGAAYVPLNSRAPWRRCREIITSCGACALVIDAPRLANLGELLEDWPLRVLIIDAPQAQAADVGLPHMPTVSLAEALAQSGEPPTAPGPDDLSYILYTSGSTGKPKGVTHTHHSGLAFANWIRETFQIVPDDVFSSHAPFDFDLSISDLYASLGSGASLRLITSSEAMLAPYLVKKTAEWGITVWYSTPSILTAMLDTGGLEERGLGPTRILFFAGEVFPTPHLIRLKKALPHTRMVNLFGPTETNVCTYYEVPAVEQIDPDKSIPIGRGCENLETFAIDDDGREVGVGEIGVLWAKGGNIMAGYWNDSARTAEMLFPDPRGIGGVACRTGDRVRLREDGHYDFLGRVDHMVKTRGYRVELGEIESVLARHPAVLEAVAIPLPDEKIGSRIVATIVLQTDRSASDADLRAHCSRHLPIYMIPDQIEIREAMPRTSTGKADRSALTREWEMKNRHEH